MSILRSNGPVEILKSTENGNSKGLGWVKNKNVFVERFKKPSKKDFFIEYFRVDFCQLSCTNVKVVHRVVGWVLAIKSKHFRDFLEIS